jgi:hypothetical protein
MRWIIHRAEKRADGWAPGPVVGEINAETRQLKVHDAEFEELLDDLFNNDQTVIAGREEEDRLSSTTVDFLPAWEPATLQHVRARLGRHGLIAQDA